jgi:methylated-DNA-protein-cysteine methyltransferase-like protein
VVNRNGLLTGKAHFNPPERMQNKLEEEGICVVEDQIQNWDNVFWDPSIHLTL